MTFNPDIFKAYDIRGIYQQDFDEDFAYHLGLAFADFIQEKTNKQKITLVTARDMRTSSPSIQESLNQGLIDKGVKVINIDLSSTPTFYFAVAQYNHDGGIIVSASHNPKEWNGFKIVREKALPVSENTGLHELKEKIEKQEVSPSQTKGSIETTSQVLTEQIKHDLSFSHLDNISPLKVVVDAANGMGAQYMEALAKHINIDLIKLNFSLDGTFPAHEADPLKEENLQPLKDKVVEEKADLGISIDGDGDRVFFVDETGNSIKQSIIRAILSKIFLRDKPGSKICYDIRPGQITEDVIRQEGGIPIETKVGHSLIKQRTIQENAYFAGESSGHFFLNMDIGCFEVPVIATLKLLEEFSSTNSVSEYINPYDKYFHSGEINRKVKDKQAVLERIKHKYSDGDINLLDGVSVKYDQFWFNVRTSNTEEKVRLNLEAKDEKTMTEKTQEILHIITE